LLAQLDSSIYEEMSIERAREADRQKCRSLRMCGCACVYLCVCVRVYVPIQYARRHARMNSFCVLQCAAVCCSVLQDVAACCCVNSICACTCVHMHTSKLITVCCSMLQCVTACCSVLQCVAVCCSVTWIVAHTHMRMHTSKQTKQINKLNYIRTSVHALVQELAHTNNTTILVYIYIHTYILTCKHWCKQK